MVTVKCLTAVTYYYLPVEILQQVGKVYPSLMSALRNAQTQANQNHMFDLEPCDYIEANCRLNQKFSQRRIDLLTPDEIQRLPTLRLLLKNATLHYLAIIRKKSKHNTISKVAIMIYNKKKKQLNKDKTFKKELSGMGLMEKLNTLENQAIMVKGSDFDKLDRVSS